MKQPTFDGTALESLRLKAKLSRADLAERVGISRQMLRYVEIGQNSPSFDVACRIADALGVKLDSLRTYRNPS